MKPMDNIEESDKKRQKEEQEKFLEEGIYRIGHESSFGVGLHEVKIEKVSGLVKSMRGISVFKNPKALEEFRDKYKINRSNDVSFEVGNLGKSKFAVYFKDSTELADFEGFHKAYRLDVYVSIGEKFYNVHVFTPEKIVDEFRFDIANLGYHDAEPSLILVKNVLRNDIVQTLEKIYVGEMACRTFLENNKKESNDYFLHERDMFFDKLKPLSVQELENLDLTEIYSICN